MTFEKVKTVSFVQCWLHVDWIYRKGSVTLISGFLPQNAISHFQMV